MKQYLTLLNAVMATGQLVPDRTGTGTLSIFGGEMRFNLSEGFPALTTKKVFLEKMADELRWFLSGSTNINDLPERTRGWWSSWADLDGDLGPIYGEQWRRQLWVDDIAELIEVDQLKLLIDGIIRDPHSRRHVVNLWHTAAMQRANLPCCHGSVVQFFVGTDRRLSCQMYQRSADMFIGVPVNIASYALLTHLVAREAGLLVGDLIWVGGDCHVYLNHREQVREQLSRPPKDFRKTEVQLDYQKGDIFTGGWSFDLLGYDPHPTIKAPVAV